MRNVLRRRVFCGLSSSHYLWSRGREELTDQVRRKSLSFRRASEARQEESAVEFGNLVIPTHERNEAGGICSLGASSLSLSLRFLQSQGLS
jgi:hypothetical protein